MSGATDRPGGATMPLRGGWAFGLGCWGLCLLVALALYSPTLHTPLFGDELSLIATVAPWMGNGWQTVFAPIANGFIRIPMNATGRILLELFGPEPLPFHLAAIGSLAAMAAMAGVLARRLTRSNGAGLLAALLTITHIGTWGSGVMLANSCDTFLALAGLAGLVWWDDWLDRRGGARLAGVALAGLCALASKETGVVYPAWLLLWALGRRRLNRRALSVVAAAGLAVAFYLAWSLLRQVHAQTSYLHAGAFDAAPLHWLRSWADYCVSSAFPYLHAIQPPWFRLRPPGWLLWLTRLAVAAGGLWVAARLIRRGSRGDALPEALLACAAVGLLPAGLLAGPPQIRFLTLAAPFVVVAAVVALWRTRGSRAFGPLAAAMEMLWLTFVPGFFASPSMRNYSAEAVRTGRFLAELRRVAPGWPRHATVCIADPPSDAPQDLRWVYTQLLLNIYLPEKDAHLRLGPPTPEADAAYRFGGGRLEPVAIPKPAGRPGR